MLLSGLCYMGKMKKYKRTSIFLSPLIFSR